MNNYEEDNPSYLGFGIMRLPLIGGRPYMSKIRDMLDEYMEADVPHYFDTHPNYMNKESEAIVRECIVKRYPRDSYHIAAKLPRYANTPDDFEVYLNRSLDELGGIAYVDYYMLHAMDDNFYEKNDDLGAFEFLNKVKKQGRAKKVGFSFHGTSKLLEKILKKHGDVDFVQLQINFFDWESDIIQSRKCYEIARQYNKEIIVMEPIKGGIIAGLKNGEPVIKAAFDFVRSLPGVSYILSGMSDKNQVKENIEIFNDPISFNHKDLLFKDLIEKINQTGIQCTKCGYCENKCPRNIPIRKAIEILNYTKVNGGINDSWFNMFYNFYLSDEANVTGCVACGQCNKECPQHIDVCRHMKEAKDIMNKENRTLPNAYILLELLKLYGVKKFVLSPGATNGRLISGIVRAGFEIFRMVDERNAAFFALGLADRLEEPIAICCTSGTAAANYLPAVEEAFYRRVPLVVITADRLSYFTYQKYDQKIMQKGIYRGCIRYETTLPMINNQKDINYTNRVVNEALIKMKTGPVHINVEVDEFGEWDDSIIPKYKKIEQINLYSKSDGNSIIQYKEKLKKSKILLICGQRGDCSNHYLEALNNFVSSYNVVVAAESISNYYGEKRINPFVLSKGLGPKELMAITPDIVITTGGQYLTPWKSIFGNEKISIEHWDINREGNIVDLMERIDGVIISSEEEFFREMSKTQADDLTSYYESFVPYLDKISKLENVFEESFTNNYVVKNVIEKLPENSLVHLGIDSIVKVSNAVNIPNSTLVYSNRGTTGIEGGVSTFLGQSYYHEGLCVLIIGDLSFFYGMNGLWTDYIKGNVRIVLCNNGGGETFLWNGLANKLTDKELQIALSNHKTSAKGWVESLGIGYNCAKNKEEFDRAIQELMDCDVKNPMLLEVITDMKSDSEVLLGYYNSIKESFAKEYAVINGRYFIYGIGAAELNAREKILEYGGTVVGYCDTNKAGTIYRGFTVMPPDELKTKVGECDKIVISSKKYFMDIVKGLIERGIDENKIIFIE